MLYKSKIYGILMLSLVKGGGKVAKTKKGKKIVPVKKHTRKVPGKKKPITVDPHRRSTPN